MMGVEVSGLWFVTQPMYRRPPLLVIFPAGRDHIETNTVDGGRFVASS